MGSGEKTQSCPYNVPKDFADFSIKRNLSQDEDRLKVVWMCRTLFGEMPLGFNIFIRAPPIYQCKKGSQ
jgi:hypothetical protein